MKTESENRPMTFRVEGNRIYGPKATITVDAGFEFGGGPYEDQLAERIAAFLNQTARPGE
jgi:hypothetical protein